MCKFSRVFDHVKPPKNARIVDKKKKKKKNPEENNRALRLSGLGPNNNNNKRSRFNRVLCTIGARSLINNTDTIGSSHHRCSVPNNNKRSRFNRVLCTIGARSLKTDLSVESIIRRIGVFVDHGAGTLSFYSVSDTMSLIHTVQTTFTQTLYPGFSVGYESSVKLC